MKYFLKISTFMILLSCSLYPLDKNLGKSRKVRKGETFITIHQKSDIPNPFGVKTDVGMMQIKFLEKVERDQIKLGIYPPQNEPIEKVITQKTVFVIETYQFFIHRITPSEIIIDVDAN